MTSPDLVENLVEDRVSFLRVASKTKQVHCDDGFVRPTTKLTNNTSIPKLQVSSTTTPPAHPKELDAFGKRCGDREETTSRRFLSFGRTMRHRGSRHYTMPLPMPTIQRVSSLPPLSYYERRHHNYKVVTEPQPVSELDCKLDWLDSKQRSMKKVLGGELENWLVANEVHMTEQEKGKRHADTHTTTFTLDVVCSFNSNHVKFSSAFFTDWSLETRERSSYQDQQHLC